MHPHFFPFVALLLIQLGASLTLLILTALRLWSGSDRAATLGWLLLGTTPVWLFVAHFAYGASSMFMHHIALNTPVKMIGVGVASLADLMARVQYPYRHSGEHTVLITRESERPRDRLAVMDQHIERMACILHRSSDVKTHWIYGPIFGRPGWYLQGLSICDVAEGPWPALREGPLRYLDYHEAAHCAIERVCGADSQAPCVLVEGWAESQSGYEPDFLALRAWNRKQKNEVVALRDLTTKQYAVGEWPAYEFGGALVEYLLHTYGGEKFFDLYANCRRATFDQDCKRILGASVDELEHKYWQYVEQRVKELGPQRNRLLGVELSDDVDRDAWIDFAKGYSQAIAALQAPFHQATIHMSGHRHRGKDDELPFHYVFMHDGVRSRMVVEEDGVRNSAVATPDGSFVVARQSDHDSWSLSSWESTGRNVDDYASTRQWIENCESVLHLGCYLAFQHQVVDRCGNSGFRITRFRPLAEGEEQSVRIDFEYASGNADGKPTRGWITLLPKRNWSAKAYEVVGFDENRKKWIQRGSFFYSDDKLARPTVPRRTRIETLVSNEESTVREAVLTRYEAGPPPDDAFRPEAFGVSDTARRQHFLAAQPMPEWRHWYVIFPTTAGVISLATGLVLTSARRKIR